MNDSAERLAARALLYRLFHSLTSGPPEEQTVEAALSELIGEALDICEVPYDDAALSALRAAFEQDEAAAVAGAQDQYQRLFYQPGKLAAPPWESSYVSDQRKVFQRSTLETRRMYRESGLRPNAVNRIPDDHIALELGFLSELARRMCEGDASARSQAAAASALFLDDHLSKWVIPYTQDAEGAAKGEFYAWVNATLRSFIEADNAFVHRLERDFQVAEIGK